MLQNVIKGKNELEEDEKQMIEGALKLNEKTGIRKIYPINHYMSIWVIKKDLILETLYLNEKLHT